LSLFWLCKGLGHRPGPSPGYIQPGTPPCTPCLPGTPCTPPALARLPGERLLRGVQRRGALGSVLRSGPGGGL